MAIYLCISQNFLKGSHTKSPYPGIFWSTGPAHPHGVSTWASGMMRWRTSSWARWCEYCWRCPEPARSSRSSRLWGALGHMCTHPKDTLPLRKWRWQWLYPDTETSPGWTGVHETPTSSAGGAPHSLISGIRTYPSPPGRRWHRRGWKQSHQTQVTLWRERKQQQRSITVIRHQQGQVNIWMTDEFEPVSWSSFPHQRENLKIPCFHPWI